MATQGQLANSKPAANTNTLLYSSPIDDAEEKNDLFSFLYNLSDKS